jgi:hypothetical protein
VPDLPPEGTWIGEDPGKMAPLAAKGPVLVHFFDFSQLNSVRTLPYLIEWHRRYETMGLRVIGVQAPRFPFGADPETVRAGLERLGVSFPVVIDDQRILWNSYGCEGWPSLFLWGRGGRLKWFQFGEGEYRSTEEAIQAALAGPPDRCSSAEPEQDEDTATATEGTNGDRPDEGRMPEPMSPLRPTDAEGAKVVPPGAELMPAGDRSWTIEEDGDFLEVTYEAGGVHATASGAGSIAFRLDGERTGLVEIDGPGLYSLAEHDRHGQHRVEIRLVEGSDGPPELWSLSFSPALAH